METAQHSPALGLPTHPALAVTWESLTVLSPGLPRPRPHSSPQSQSSGTTGAGSVHGEQWSKQRCESLSRTEELLHMTGRQW